MFPKVKSGRMRKNLSVRGLLTFSWGGNRERKLHVSLISFNLPLTDTCVYACLWDSAPMHTLGGDQTWVVSVSLASGCHQFPVVCAFWFLSYYPEKSLGTCQGCSSQVVCLCGPPGYLPPWFRGNVLHPTVGHRVAAHSAYLGGPLSDPPAACSSRTDL